MPTIAWALPGSRSRPGSQPLITRHRLHPAGWGRWRLFSASPESWPGDFRGNQQPAATSTVGEVLSWQPALQRHTSDLWPAVPALTWLLTGGTNGSEPEKWVPASVMWFRAPRVLGPSTVGWAFDHPPPHLHTAKPYWDSNFTTTPGAGAREGVSSWSVPWLLGWT